MTESERFDRAIERLLADESPRTEVARLSSEERDMLQMAQMLRGSSAAGPRPEFVEGLRTRLFEHERRVSRRTAFLGGISAMAAGLLAGLGIERASLSGSTASGTHPAIPIVPNSRGTWVAVADLADVPPGAVRPFTSGAINGFLVNHGGNVRAMSRICTHMGCALNFQGKEQTFVCPCHGAEFDMHGKIIYGKGGYRYELPPLPKLQVRVNGSKVEIFGA